MKPILNASPSRWKAVWGPKRVLPALLLAIACLAPSTAIARPHSHEGAKKKPGVQSGHVDNYKLDRELTHRSKNILAVIRLAFGEPKSIARDEDRRPAVTLLLLSYLGQQESDGIVRKSIVKTENYICSQTKYRDAPCGEE